jgi:hypothetical protein
LAELEAKLQGNDVAADLDTAIEHSSRLPGFWLDRLK